MAEQITFVISGKAFHGVMEFEKEHECTLPDRKPEHPALRRMMEEDPQYVGAIGGRFSYRFIPTSLGVITVVQCACGKEKNVTDFDKW